MDGRTDGQLRPTLLGRLGEVDVIKTKIAAYIVYGADDHIWVESKQAKAVSR